MGTGTLIVRARPSCSSDLGLCRSCHGRLGDYLGIVASLLREHGILLHLRKQLIDSRPRRRLLRHILARCAQTTKRPMGER